MKSMPFIYIIIWCCSLNVSLTYADQSEDVKVKAKINEYLNVAFSYKPGGVDSNIAISDRIQYALDFATRVRKGDSQNLILRNAEYYLLALYSAAAGDFIYETALLFMPAYVKCKYAAHVLQKMGYPWFEKFLRANPNKPTSAPSGSDWTDIGLCDGHKIDGYKEIKAQTNHGLSLFTCDISDTPFLTPDLLILLKTGEKPWKKDEEDIDVYYMNRKPASVPATEEEVKRIGDYIQIRDTCADSIDPNITESYGKIRDDLNGNSKVHNGCDFSAPLGSDILWMYDENETMVESRYYSPWSGQSESSNYGNQITIFTKKDNKTYLLRFCHITNVINEETGNLWEKYNVITKGSVIAKVGSSGRIDDACKPHFHLEVFEFIENNYVRINPLDFFNSANEAPTLPPEEFRMDP